VIDRPMPRALVPLAHVKSVPRAIEFYAKLGFVAAHTHTPDGGTEPVWASLEAGGAQIMVSRSREPFDPEQQAVLFYLYTPDVDAFRASLLAAGVRAGAIEHPFWAPRGEFRVEDPDGYVVMVTHT